MLKVFKKGIYNSQISKPLFFALLLLLSFGLINFLSASLGVLNRNEDKFFNILETQLISYVIGLCAFFVALILHYKVYYKYALLIGCSAGILGFLVFIPGLGYTHGGGTRWLNILGFSLQPGEILKLAAVIVTSWFVYKFQNKFDDWRYSVLIFGLIIFVCALIMFLQKDLGTLLIICIAAFAVYFTGGAKWKHILCMGLVGVILISVYAFFNPYVLDRLDVFSDKNNDSLGSSYQTNQALIAIGTGGVVGKGLGQSVQKFSYLPEPVGDSIFAVSAEEWGFLGGVTIIGLYAFIIIYCLQMSTRIQNVFAKSLVVGIIVIIFSHTVLNIASMLGLMPLSGDVLPLFSQGGTALIVNLFEFGLLLQLSKYKV